MIPRSLLPVGHFLASFLPYACSAALFLLLVPLLFGLADATSSPSTIQPKTGRFLQLFGNTLYVAGLAAILSLLIALPLGWLLSKATIKQQRFLLPLIVLPLFLCTPAVAVASIRLFGPAGLLTNLLFGTVATFPISESIRGSLANLPQAPLYTLTGTAFVLAWAFHPLAILGAYLGFSSIPRELAELSRLDSTPFQRFRSVYLPVATPGILLGAFFVFLLAIVDFGIPEALRSQPVLIAEVYVQAAVFYNPRGAAITSLIVVLLLIILTIPLMRRLRVDFPENSELVNSSTLNLRVLLPLTLLPTLLLVFSLWITATGPQGRFTVWKIVWQTASEEILKSLLLSLGAALLILAGGFILAWSLFGKPLSRLHLLALAFPFLLPGILPALGISVLSRQVPGPLGDVLHQLNQTHAPLLLIWFMKYTPLAALFFYLHWRQVFSGDLQTAWRLDASTRLPLYRLLLLPTSAKPALLGFLAALGLTLGEVGAAVLLMPPGVTNVSIRVLTMLHYAPDGQMSTLCLFLVAPSLLLALIFSSSTMFFGSTPPSQPRETTP
jgi:iron(III) transport system permease protein